MRNVLFIAITLFFSSCASQKKAYLFTSFHEPADQGLRLMYSYDGYKWTDMGKTFLHPEIGRQKVMRDPSMVQGPDGEFHLVWTSSWKDDKGYGYAHSKDLINWSEQRFLPVMEHEPGTVNVWAPEIFYDDVSRQYIIVWASTIPFRFEKGLEPDSNNHRLYYTTTKDFKDVPPGKLFLDPKFSVIDAEIVKFAKGQYVLVLKDNTRPNRNIKVAFGEKAEGPYTNVSAPFTQNFTEGPSVAKVKDGWLIYFDAYREKKYGAVFTKDFKTFEKADSLVSVPEGHKHGTVLMVSRKFLKELLKQN